MRLGRSPTCALAAVILAACSAEPGRRGIMHPATPSLSGAPASLAGRGLAGLRQDADALEPLVETPWVKRFLRASEALPSIKPRVVYEDTATGSAYTAAAAGALPEAQRKALAARAVDDDFYYTTKYGSPLAYARALDVVAVKANVTGVEGKRLLDFGYGGVGHLRLLASLGARVTAVDVDPLLTALYGEPEDQGSIKGYDGAKDGSLALVSGQFPADPRVRAAVGTGYDGFVSKNTLKRGYIHPSQPTDERKLIRLGVDDATFLRTLHDTLKPGAFAMIYNISPAPAAAGKPYIPWADGRSPFTREDWEASGFRVLDLDRDDTEAARAQARALGWDHDPERPVDIEHDVFALYTLVVR